MNIESTKQSTPNRTHRVIVAGVTAGLLGGGAVGLLLTVPSFTSAASDDTGAVAPIVALQDEQTDVPDAVLPEPGQHLRDLLQQLVDDGTLEGPQADAVVELMMENRPQRPDRGPGGRQRRPGFDGEVVAGLLGIDIETFRMELRAGSSVAEIAVAHDIEPQTVIDALVAEATAHIDQMVEDQRLSADEAADKVAQISERIAAHVNGECPGLG